VPVIVNIAGETINEYAEIAKKLDGIAGISGLEVNISCPNVKAGGAEFGMNPDVAAMITRSVKKATSLPVLVKLTPNTYQLIEVAKAVAKAGADALTLINTIKGLAIDIYTRKLILGNGCGGLSGPAIKPIALGMVYDIAGAVPIPVIGCGGIATAGDALEFIMAGASAIQVGTAIFSNPHAPIEILEGLKKFMQEQGIEQLAELVGVANKQIRHTSK